ncbi:MAG: GNAT family N-acetyltransferase [Pelagimonas sp.]|nr:GNAT family N-acetyltransferase [Pelagimonas sp.]
MPSAFLLTKDELLAAPLDRLADGIASGVYLGAFRAEQLVGFVIARRGGVQRLQHTGDIGPLYVAPSAQKQGVGKALMQRALDQLAQAGLLQVELTVDADNAPAVTLYQSLGFITFGRRPRSVLVDGEPRNDLLMIRALDGADLCLDPGAD